MRETTFYKMVGAGNDFILVDARRRKLERNPSALAQIWCDRRRGIGADGLLLVLPSRRAEARMRIFNPDGSEATMCGNGLRCVAWYLHRCGSHPGNGFLSLETGAGILQATIVARERTRIVVAAPRKLMLHTRLPVRGKNLTIHSVNTGVPHVVVLTSRLNKMDLALLGPTLRRHPFFKPQGTNVNFVHIQSPRRIGIRTYERGVEAETLACGTGAVASVVIGTALGKLTPPIQVKTASGEPLVVDFKEGRNFEKGATLEGPARILFRGATSL